MNSHITMTRIRLLLAMVLLLAASFGSAQEKKLSSELNSRLGRSAALSSSEMIDVVIQFRQGTPLSNHVAKLLGLGAKHKNSFETIHGGLFQIPASLLPILANDPDIAYISPDRPIKHTSWWDFALDASQATPVINAGYTGDDIGVAIIDSGVHGSHPDFQDTRAGSTRVVYSQSFVPGDASVEDQYGHGTHVAGLVAGNGFVSGGGMIGIAPEANIINLRVLDANGASTDSTVIAAIERAIQLKNTYNIRVINLSLGRPVAESYTLDPLCQAVEQAWKAGIVVVVAAGNDGRDNSQNTNGYATIAVPGNDPYVITVGATNTHATDATSDDTVTSYSSKGPTLLDHVIKPDLVAPGNRIVSLLANGSTLDRAHPSDELPPSAYNSNSNKAAYVYLSGTSMATPIVSGTVALMLDRNPNLTPDQIKIRLMKTASKSYPSYSSATSSSGNYYSLQNDIFAVGAGYVNAYGAVASNELPTGTSLSPIAVRDTSGNVNLQADSSSAWANTSTWGTSIVWGPGLQGDSLVWGSSIVWGTSTDSGYSIVWGTTIVWGTSTPFSESTDSDNN